MQQQSFALCSNQLTKLFGTLVEDISSQRVEGELLSFRCIVPSASLKGWLNLRLVQAGVAPLAGEILVLEEALSPHSFSRRALLPLLVSFLERNKSKEWCQSLFDGERDSLSKERIYSIAKKHLLAFAQLTFLGEEEWFRKRKCEAIGEAFVQFSKKEAQKYSLAPSYLFGFSSLHGGALARLLNSFDVRRIYLLSPSMLFWGDLSSDSELRFLLQKNPSPRFEEALMPYIHERQRLLANSGVIGREFFNLLEDLDLPVTQLYAAPEALFSLPPYKDLAPEGELERTSAAPTLLDFVKADLLFLVGTRDSPQTIPQDDSIEIHATYTPLREVEALREYLWRHFGGKDITAGSVIVLVTDLQRYAAPFEQVFGGPRSLYQSWDGVSGNDVVSLLHSLLSLVGSQGGVRDFLPLLKHKGFLDAFEVGREEREEIITLFEKLDFISIKSVTRERYLKQRGIHPQHKAKTLEDLYRGEVAKLFGEELSLTKSSHLAFLARVRAWISRVDEIVPLPIESHVFQDVATWVEFFTRLFEPFMTEDGSFSHVEKALAAFREYPENAFLPFSEQVSLLFSELREALQACPHALRAPIMLGELGSLQPFPAEVVAILGAEEGSLPKENEDPLKYLERLPPTLYPSSKLYERYAFIEALLSAERLFIGYQSYAFELRETIPPSPIVGDLLAHIDSNYLLAGEKPSQVLVRNNPLQGKRREVSLSTSLETVRGKRKEARFINLSDIQKTAKNPLLSYLRAQFGSVAEWGENDSIFIKPYEIKQHLEEQFLGKELFSQREHPLALKAYEEAKGRVSHALQEMNLSSLSSLTVEFSPTITSLTRVGDTVFAPQLESRGYAVRGSVKGLLRPGLILFTETWRQELFQKWFEYVVRSFLAKTEVLQLEDALIIIKERRVEPFHLKDPVEQLHQWVAFSQLACNFPFPFSYDVVKLLLKKPALEELVTKVTSEMYSLKLQPEQIEAYKGMWEEWAHTLFGELLLREGA